ncbi:hypothetical protein ILUMI_24269 [Ignelater luminosus]|uniref:Sulfatase N-terminal domain-containing protein n=1 Tax=Ignelater luminosus TaxID=2038154 RepID=A0A8K0C7B2_IGNLU|nr:hypothetical protein ILUMI_24269 [Ignelater luminosus]
MKFSKLTLLLIFGFTIIFILISTICFYTIKSFKSSKTAIRPHIILIVADDVGWNDVGFHGSNQIPTPNIDALAYNGIILNRFYTAPSCTPSRTALLTGHNPIRFGLQGIPIAAGENLHLPIDVPTLPERLKELGYKTHLIGKWNLGAAFRNVTPNGRGFDSFFGYWSSYISYFDHEGRASNMTGFDMHSDFEPAWDTYGQYATHLFTEIAEKMMRKHNVKEPMFLMLSHLAAHSGKNGTELEVPDDEENDRIFGYIDDVKRRRYAGIIHEMDKSVGRVMEILAERKMLDNSVVIILSDNGAQTSGNLGNAGSNWPLRGLKMTVHEGGVRNFAAAYSPLFQKPRQVNNDLLFIADLLPTFYAAGGGNIENLGPMDGINQWQLLTENARSKRSEVLLHLDEVRFTAGYISDYGRYKLINGSTLSEDYDLYYGEDGRGNSSPPYNINAVINSSAYIAIGKNIPVDEMLQLRKEATLGNCRKPISPDNKCTYKNWCLYDLFDDPCETTNIASTHPEVVKRLGEKLTEAWKYLKPQKPKIVDPKSNPIYNNNTWFTWLDD